MLTKAKLIALEGIDGAGTSTQAKRVAAALTRLGIEATHTSHPSRGPVGTLIRKYTGGAFSRPTAELQRSFFPLLFCADMLEHLSNDILPNLKRGITVICDRYVLSTYAYNTIRLDRLNWLMQLCMNVPKPDITIVLTVSPELGMERVKARGKKPDIYENLDFQKTVAKNYHDLMTLIPGVKQVDGEKPENEVTEEIMSVLDTVLRNS